MWHLSTFLISMRVSTWMIGEWNICYWAVWALNHEFSKTPTQFTYATSWWWESDNFQMFLPRLVSSSPKSVSLSCFPSRLVKSDDSVSFFPCFPFFFKKVLQDFNLTWILPFKTCKLSSVWVMIMTNCLEGHFCLSTRDNFLLVFLLCLRNELSAQWCNIFLYRNSIFVSKMSLRFSIFH